MSVFILEAIFDLTASDNCPVSSAWLVFFNELHALVYAPRVFTEGQNIQQGADRHPNAAC